MKTKDLSADMRPGKPVSARMRAMLNKEKAEARKRVIERGIMHFRADAEFMEALLAEADKSKVAPGTLCRRIVWEYLQSSKKNPIVAEENGSYSSDSREIIQRLDRIEALISKPAPKLKRKDKA